MAEPLSEHTYIACSLIHGAITLSHRGFIQTSQRSSRTSLRFNRKGALRGELTKIESRYTSHPVMTLWITMLAHSFQSLHMHTPLQCGLIAWLIALL